MKNLKKILAVVMAVAMIFALSIPAFATGNILSAATSFIPGSLYSQTAAPGDTVYLYATIVTDAYPSSLVGFSSQSDAAANVSWTVTSGASKVDSISASGISFVYNDVTYYAAKLTVELDDNATPGMVVINAAGQNGAPTNTDCNYVIMVEDSNATPTSASNITVELYDLSSQSLIASLSGATVDAACEITNGKFNGSLGAAQTYATAANTVDYLLSDAEGRVTNVDTTYGYVSSMTVLDDFDDPIDYDESYDPISYQYIGWMYGVYRSNSYVSTSESVSATAFELQNGDIVVWVYGTFAQATTFFSNYTPST